MKTCIKTVLWMLVLVGVAAYFGQKHLLRAWNGRDQFLKQQVVKSLQQLLPDVEIRLEAVQYDFGHEVILVGLSLASADGAVPVLQLPKTVVHINRDALIERQQLEVWKVIVKSPRLDVVRSRDGRWNWQSLLPQSAREKGSLPEFVIEDGTITVCVEQVPGVPPGVLVLEHVDVGLLPSGKRQFQITATSRCEHTGGIKLTGRWHIDDQTGQLDGEFTQMTAGQELVGVAASFVPEVRTKLAEWETRFLELLAASGDGPNGSPFALPPAVKTVGPADSIFGLKATFNLAFRITRTEPRTTPMFRVAVKIDDGEITNPVLPFPLHNLRADLYADNDRFAIKELTAHNGATRLRVNGQLEGRAEGYPGRIELTVDNIACDQRLRSRLSAGFGRIYDQHHPTGELNLHAFLVHDAGRWRPEGLLVTAKDCKVVHDTFPYPIEAANGSIQQQGRDLVIDLRGLAGGRPITLEGTVHNPGPNATVLLTIRTSDLPIDETFLQACHPQLRAAIAKMRLTGLLDGEVRLTKAPQQPFVPVVEAVLRNGTVNYESFQYPIQGITGRLSAVGANFEFKDVLGRRGASRFAAEGSYRKRGANTGELKLRVVTQGVPLDTTLYDALPVSLQRVWTELRPTGTVNVVTDIEWLTGQPAVIRMPQIELRDGSLTLRSLPYRLDDCRGHFSFGPDEQGQPRLIAKSLTGRHGDLTLSASGWQMTESDGNWRAHFDQIEIDALTPNQELVNALAALPGLRQLFASLDPQQKLRLEGVLDFRGTNDPSDPITAAWNVDTYLSGGTIHTGLDFKNLRGKVNAIGDWDGEQARIRGTVDLVSAKILDYDLTDVRGPFRVERGTLMFGAGDLQRNPSVLNDNRQRITARVFDGLLMLDGAATLSEEPNYKVLMQLRSGRLERFAALHAPKQRDLKGIANGWVQLEGKGSSAQAVKGAGQLEIRPAALINMPLMLQMYSSLNFTPPSDYAFDEASLAFGIELGRFIFKRIQLKGGSIGFEGSGTVDFDSNANLTFYSRLGRNQVPLPIVHELVGEATKGWVRIQVTGRLDQPRTKIETLQGSNDVLAPLQNLFRVGLQPMLGQEFLPRGINRQ